MRTAERQRWEKVEERWRKGRKGKGDEKGMEKGGKREGKGREGKGRERQEGERWEKAKKWWGKGRHTHKELPGLKPSLSQFQHWSREASQPHRLVQGLAQPCPNPTAHLGESRGVPGKPEVWISGM